MSETKNFQVPSPMPEKLYRLIDGFRLSQALFAACELEVFDKLRSASSPQSADEITKALSSDLDACNYTSHGHPCGNGITRKIQTG